MEFNNNTFTQPNFCDAGPPQQFSTIGPNPNAVMLLNALALVDNTTLEMAIQKLHGGELGWPFNVSNRSEAVATQLQSDPQLQFDASSPCRVHPYVLGQLNVLHAMISVLVPSESQTGIVATIMGDTQNDGSQNDGPTRFQVSGLDLTLLDLVRLGLTCQMTIRQYVWLMYLLSLRQANEGMGCGMEIAPSPVPGIFTVLGGEPNGSSVVNQQAGRRMSEGTTSASRFFMNFTWNFTAAGLNEDDTLADAVCQCTCSGYTPQEPPAPLSPPMPPAPPASPPNPQSPPFPPQPPPLPPSPPQLPSPPRGPPSPPQVPTEMICPGQNESCHCQSDCGSDRCGCMEAERCCLSHSCCQLRYTNTLPQDPVSHWERKCAMERNGMAECLFATGDAGLECEWVCSEMPDDSDGSNDSDERTFGMMRSLLSSNASMVVSSLRSNGYPEPAQCLEHILTNCSEGYLGELLATNCSEAARLVVEGGCVSSCSASALALMFLWVPDAPCEDAPESDFNATDGCRPEEWMGIPTNDVCHGGECAAVVPIAVFAGRCDFFCDYHGLACSAAWNETDT